MIGRYTATTMAVVCLLATVSLRVAAQASPHGLSRSEAIQLSLEHNPSLRAAMLEVQRSQQQVTAEAGRFVPVFQLDAGFTHAESPRLQRAGGSTISTNDTATVGSQLSHQFPWGTQLSLRVEGYRSTSTQQLTPGSGDSVTLGPAYGTLGRLALTQPLLRGAGTDYGEAALRQAQLATTTAQRSRNVAASQLLRDLLVAYWELWYRSRAVEIDREALQLAAQQRRDAASRARTGALAPVDVLNYETRVAELEESLASAEAQRRKQGVELIRLLGTERFDTDLRASTDLASAGHALPISREDAMAAAIAQAVELQELRAQVAEAQDRVKTAGEAERPRLDLEASLQSERLVEGEIQPAFDHVGARSAHTAHVGLIFEIPLSGATRSAERRAALLAVEAARARLRDRQQQVGSQVHASFVEADAARRRIVLAETTVKTARQQVKAQQQRFGQGAAIFIEVQQAEDTLRRAELSVARARVDFALAAIAIDHLTGGLLGRYANELPPQSGSRGREQALVGTLAIPRPGAF